jgi:FixJ family two-component response regulator
VSEENSKEERVSEQRDWLITIVDDDESVREALQSLIKSVGLRAEVFTSAEDFLASSRWRETACLILDVRMPGMGGLELQRRLTESNYHIPVIFITAHGDEEMRRRALAADAVEFLSKPFCEDALLNAVRAALNDAGEARGGGN